MSDTRELLRRGVEGFEPMPEAFERVLARRDRRRRNQRIAAGVVGIAVFVAAVWIVTSVGSLDRAQAPAGEGTTDPTETGPSVVPGPTRRAPTACHPREPRRAPRRAESSSWSSTTQGSGSTRTDE